MGHDSPQGRVYRPATDVERAEAIDLAFDYRGDVLLQLASGEAVEGYLYNRDAAASPPFLQIFPKNQTAPRTIPYDTVRSIAFAGQDPASGKSWQAWVAKKDSERRTEAQQVEAAARARGHL